MKTLRQLAYLLLPMTVFLSTTSLAQSSVTWVSGLGDDESPTCSVAAPCRTFSVAINKTSPGGEIGIMDAADFGPVTITKAITINAVGALGMINTPAGSTAVTINAGANDAVVLRGLLIDGGPNGGFDGIVFNTGAKLHLEQSTISGFSDQGVLFSPAAASTLWMNNVGLRNNGTGAIYVRPQASGTAVASLNNVRLEGNFRGLRADDGSTVVVRKSISTGNVHNGFVATSSASPARPSDLTIEDSVSSFNGISSVGGGAGVYSGPSATIRISNCTITGNGMGLQLEGNGAIVSFQNNRISANVAGDGTATQTVPLR
jgi:hypothetical protein